MVCGLWSPLAFGETNAHSQGSEALSLKGAMSVATPPAGRETRTEIENHLKKRNLPIWNVINVLLFDGITEMSCEIPRW